MMHLSQQWSTLAYDGSRVCTGYAALYSSDDRSKVCAGYAALHSSDEVASVRVVEAEEMRSIQCSSQTNVLIWVSRLQSEVTHH